MPDCEALGVLCSYLLVFSKETNEEKNKAKSRASPLGSPKAIHSIASTMIYESTRYLHAYSMYPNGFQNQLN